MRKVILSAILGLGLLTFAGCYGSSYNSTTNIKTTKCCDTKKCQKMKCDTKKCDKSKCATKEISAKKCGASGKCGSAK